MKLNFLFLLVGVASFTNVFAQADQTLVWKKINKEADIQTILTNNEGYEVVYGSKERSGETRQICRTTIVNTETEVIGKFVGNNSDPRCNYTYINEAGEFAAFYARPNEKHVEILFATEADSYEWLNRKKMTDADWDRAFIGSEQEGILLFICQGWEPVNGHGKQTTRHSGYAIHYPEDSEPRVPTQEDLEAETTQELLTHCLYEYDSDGSIAPDLHEIFEEFASMKDPDLKIEDLIDFAVLVVK